jgi:NhaC family Na+:H+ antiporter
MEQTKTNEQTANNGTPLPNIWISLIPIIALVALVALSIILFGDDSLNGSNQIALLVATGVCVCLSMWVYKTPWIKFESAIKETIGGASVSIIILLIIGMLSGAWMISGVVPTLIYYGVQIMSADFFLVSSCAICAIVSVMTGSSWTTIATIGMALLGIGEALSIPEYWTAGAIISGAYFGDKISPLSDTTVLASSASGTDIFTHIRYMLYTTTPTISITLIIFFIAGFWYGGAADTNIAEYTEGLASTFNISLWTLIVPLITAILIARKAPSLITLFVSAIIAGIVAIIGQTDILLGIAETDTPSTLSIIKGVMITFFTETSVDTGSAALNDLVSTGGMGGMMPTIWLILCAMCFGGVMVASGMLQSITNQVLRWVRTRVGLVTSTVGSGMIMNLTTSDQYISIILTANMYKDIYKEQGYEPRLLSRTTEDAVTVTSVLIPWNTCGMTQATVLGVPTLSYLPYCFFNYLSPLMSIFVAAIGWKIKKIKHKN